MSARDTTRDLRLRVARRFQKGGSGAVGMPEHIVLFEVPVDGTQRLPAIPERGIREGERKVRRRIDAVAVGMWRSTHHLVHGFEIKATRADLRKELSDPEKSAPARRLCDRWWLVLADVKLLGDDAPPAGWGVLAARGRGLTVVQKPMTLNPERDPRFVAALLQTSARGTGTIARGLGYVDGYQAGHDRGAKYGARREVEAAYLRGQDNGWQAAQQAAARRDGVA